MAAYVNMMLMEIYNQPYLPQVQAVWYLPVMVDLLLLTMVGYASNDKDGNLQSTIFTSGTVKVIALGDCGFIVVDDGRVRKYDKDGNLQSTIFTSGTVTVTVVPPCGFIVMDDGRIRKYDADGNLQSTIFTSGASSVVLTSDGGFIVIDDGRVRKYDKDGICNQPYLHQAL
jgi:hypothetical protein